MEIVYFPFTCITDRVANALAACFGSFVIYQPLRTDLSDPMQDLQKRGIMEVRVPVSGAENELKQAIRRFRIWADLHGEDLVGRTAKYQARMNSMARLSDMSSSRIVAEIKDNIPDSPSRKIPDLVQASRIFLYFAQEFDHQNHELAEELARFDREQTELIRGLKIEDDPVAAEFANPPVPVSDSADDYLIAGRLESWSRIFLRDRAASGLLVTHSAALMEYVLERASTAVQVIKTDFSSPNSEVNPDGAELQKNLIACLKRLAEQKPEDGCAAALQQTASTPAANSYELTVYQVPDQSPQELLSNCTSIETVPADRVPRGASQKNALVALIRV